MIEPPPSIGSQIDALAAHLIERMDRVAADVSRNNAKIAALQSRTSLACIAPICIVIAAIVLGLAVRSIS